MTRASNDLAANLRAIEHDRAYARTQRELVDRLDAALDREEHRIRTAMTVLGPDGDEVLVNVAGHALAPQSKPEQRSAVLQAFDQFTEPSEPGEPAGVISQANLAGLTGMDTGALSRAVRDLEISGALVRAGITPRRSPLWQRVQP